MENQDAVKLIRKVTDPELAAKMLVDAALHRNSKDDISCIVIRFKWDFSSCKFNTNNGLKNLASPKKFVYMMWLENKMDYILRTATTVVRLHFKI